MAKFKIRVTVKAECTYEVEVDHTSEANAEDEAKDLWREKLPDDFQVEKGYVTDWEVETEQLTAVCPDCNVEHIIQHDDLPICHCNQFGHNPYLAMRNPPTRDYRSRPHLIVDGVCTPEPWWWDDNEYCAACGAKIEEEDKANGR
jgi:hypothetical protein